MTLTLAFKKKKIPPEFINNSVEYTRATEQESHALLQIRCAYLFIKENRAHIVARRNVAPR